MTQQVKPSSAGTPIQVDPRARPQRIQADQQNKLIEKIEKVFGKSLEELEVRGERQEKLEELQKAYTHFKSLSTPKVRRYALKLLSLVPKEDRDRGVRNGVEAILERPERWEEWGNPGAYEKNFSIVLEALASIEDGERGDVLSLVPRFIPEDWGQGAQPSAELLKILSLIPKEERTHHFLNSLGGLLDCAFRGDLVSELVESIRLTPPKERCDVIRRVLDLKISYHFNSEIPKILNIMKELPKNQRKSLVELAKTVYQSRIPLGDFCEGLVTLPAEQRTLEAAKGLDKLLLRIKYHSCRDTSSEELLFALTLLAPEDRGTLLRQVTEDRGPWDFTARLDLDPLLNSWNRLASTPVNQRDSLREKIEFLLHLPGSETWTSDSKVDLITAVGGSKWDECLEVLELVSNLLEELHGLGWKKLKPSAIIDLMAIIGKAPVSGRAGVIAQVLELSAGAPSNLDGFNEWLRLLVEKQDQLPPAEAMERIVPCLHHRADFKSRIQLWQTIVKCPQEELLGALDRLEASFLEGYHHGLTEKFLALIPAEDRYSEVKQALSTLMGAWNPVEDKIEDYLSQVEKLPTGQRAGALTVVASIFGKAKPQFSGHARLLNFRLISHLAIWAEDPEVTTGLRIFAKAIQSAEREGDRKRQKEICEILHSIPEGEIADFLENVGPACRSGKRFKTVLKILRRAKSLSVEDRNEVFGYSKWWGNKDTQANLRFVNYTIKELRQGKR